MKFVKIFPVALFLLVLISCQQGIESNSTKEESHARLEKLFPAIENFDKSPEDSLYLGYHPRGDWPSNTLAQYTSNSDSLKKYKQDLLAIEDQMLTEQEKISKQIMLINLQNRIDVVGFNLHLIPFNAEGGFYNQMAYVIPNLPFGNVQNYRDYLAWLPRYDTLIQENISIMRMGIAEGIVAPKIIVYNTLELLKSWSVMDYRQSPFFKPFKNLPSNIDEADRKVLAQAAEATVTRLTQTYKMLSGFMENEYMMAAKDEPGIGALPGGKAYYENRVRYFTTLPLTPDSVHQLGLSEVARIQASMDDVIQRLKFKGSFADFIYFLRTDDQFYAKSPEELLSYAAWLSKKSEGQLPKLFNTLYSLPFTVEPVPASIAPTYTSGRYVPGSWDARRAGIYWVNTYDLKSRTLYTLPALTLHEAVPGHHLQISLASAIKDIPPFRTRYYISAFGEGWGLYSEYLGEEMGMYTTPYELFGRYTYEMWRACRLVVDTGIHYKGWSREQALNYLSEHTALSVHEVTTEIDRYIGWPGQALSYKVGEIKIKALRKKAEAELGEKFEIGKFHAAILEQGSVPLGTLEAQVDHYIENTLTKK